MNTGARRLPFYRSRATRGAFIATGAYLCWAFVWGPSKWRNTPSLHWLNEHGLPRGFLIAVLAVYTLAHLIGTLWPAMVGCVAGLLLFGWELVALLATLDVNNPSNPLTMAAVWLALTLHYACLRLIFVQKQEEGAARRATAGEGGR